MRFWISNGYVRLDTLDWPAAQPWSDRRVVIGGVVVGLIATRAMPETAPIIGVEK